MKFLLTALVLFVSPLALAQQTQGKETVDRASSLISKGTIVIDVRQEACEGYVKGANLISIDKFLSNKESTQKKVLELTKGDKNKKIITYCRSGGRAGKAADILKNWGYTQIENIGGVGTYFDSKTMEKCPVK